MEKENYWSHFAADFEKRNIYVIGKPDLKIVKAKVADQHALGRVLELGCGNGTYSELIAPNADHVLATDFSDEMVCVAQKKLKTISNVRVEKQNCLKTSYEDNSFDTVIMVNLLHIISDPRCALEEAGRVLKPGGKIIILSFTTAGMSLWHKMAMIYRYLRTYGKPPEEGRHLDTKSVRDLLLRSGFAVEETTIIGERCKAIWARGVFSF
ncbi:MAG: class I SAM-dependent methyltransferase [Desulfobacteraceae bacterium]|nr:class I SAM-dependent methyltransferase [Desulfobacteraceae bacterium]